MDSEKFDKVVLDLLYDELDELTRASAVRHMEQSSRARRIYSGLRATREVGRLPMVEPPEDLEAKILAAEREARADRSLLARVSTVVTVLAGYAMKPQLAMAALLLLMLGSSLIFLRARPGAHERVQVTERGVPESENEAVAIVPMERAPTPEDKAEQQAHGVLRSTPGDEDRSESRRRTPPPQREASRVRRVQEGTRAFGFGQELGEKPSAEEEANEKGDGAAQMGTAFFNAMLAYREGRFAEARDGFDEVARAGGSDAATATLFAARASERVAGCEVARTRYEDLARRYEGAPVALEARWLAAECHREIGDTRQARDLYEKLLASSDYAERAEQALEALNAPSGRPVRSDRASAAGRAKAAAPPAAKAESPPASAQPKPRATNSDP